jgi:hypothetical protein
MTEDEITDDLNRATVPFSEFSASLLALTIAAGGRIEVKDADLWDLTSYRLVVDEVKATGVKTYTAVRI